MLSLATVAVAERAEHRRDGDRGARAVAAATAGLVFFDMPRVDVSSTLVRARAAAGKPIRYLVPGQGGELHRSADRCTARQSGAGGMTRAMTDRPLEPRELADRIAAIASDRKAIDIRVLDLREVLGYTDYFVVCTGNTERQTKAIYDAIHKELKDEHGLLPRREEGVARGALDPDGLPRLRRAHLHAGGARLLPPRAALGRGPGGVGRLALSSARRTSVRVC